MEKKEKQLPKATVELAKEYDALIEKWEELFDSIDELVDIIEDKLNHLSMEYDWSNVKFTDPETGKTGLKDVAGRILIPAQYDDVLTVGTYVFRHNSPHAVVKDGKVGIVMADGSGKELSDFCFDDLSWLHFSDLFVAKWDGDKEHFGFVDAHGDVVCPNILTGFSEAKINNIIFTESDGKYGVIDGRTHLCVFPEFDDVESSPDEYIVFRINGKEGYITDKGEFVTKEQVEKDERYDHVHFLHCMAE